jgi:hypothetical protein
MHARLSRRAPIITRGYDTYIGGRNVVGMSATEWERPVDKFRRTAAGSVVAAGLLGLRDGLEGRPEKEEPAIVSEAPGAPPRGSIEVILDFEHPERSVVYLYEAPGDTPAADG